MSNRGFERKFWIHFGENLTERCTFSLQTIFRKRSNCKVFLTPTTCFSPSHVIGINLILLSLKIHFRWARSKFGCPNMNECPIYNASIRFRSQNIPWMLIKWIVGTISPEGKAKLRCRFPFSNNILLLELYHPFSANPRILFDAASHDDNRWLSPSRLLLSLFHHFISRLYTETERQKKTNSWHRVDEINKQEKMSRTEQNNPAIGEMTEIIIWV